MRVKRWRSKSIILTILLMSFFSANNMLYAEEVEEVEEECFIEDTLCLPIIKKRTDYIQNELLLLFPKNFTKQQQQGILERYQLNEISVSELKSLGISINKVNTNGQDALELREKINRIEEDIEAATNNVYQSIFKSTGDDATLKLTSRPSAQTQSQSSSYAHAITGVGRALNYSTGKGILIGMIDGPVDLDHRAFKGRVRQINLVADRPRSLVYLSHGSAMAGVLVARNPYIGVAPDAQLLSISAFAAKPKSNGLSNSALVAKAIDIAIREKVDILNLSFAGGNDPLVSRVIRKALDAGIFVVAACGNDASKKPAFPAALSGVIAVTAVDSHRNLYSRANTGSYIDIAAPGVDVLTTAPGNRYALSTGTSIATAHVSASLALLMAKKTNIRRNILGSTALDLGPPGPDNVYGNGLINVMNAMQQLLR